MSAIEINTGDAHIDELAKQWLTLDAVCHTARSHRVPVGLLVISLLRMKPIAKKSSILLPAKMFPLSPSAWVLASPSERPVSPRRLVYSRIYIRSYQASSSYGCMYVSKCVNFWHLGLRAAMGAGFSRMNDLTVIQATQGLCRYIQEAQSTTTSVIIGFDGRHNSSRFAKLAAVAFLTQGFKVYLFSGESLQFEMSCFHSWDHIG
jgi:hypothetical protein